jgi:hypothetical protein
MWYAFDNATGNSVSLKTRVKAEAVQKVNAMNETERQPGIRVLDAKGDRRCRELNCKTGGLRK